MKLAATLEQEITFADFTAPTVTKVEQNGPKGIKVYFSEPITGSSAGFSIDGGKYYATVGAVDAQRYSVDLNFGTVLPEGAHTVVVNKTNNVKDAANLFVAETTMNFNMVKDTVAATIVSAEAKSQTKVVLTFNEPLDATYAATTTLSNYYHSATNYIPTAVAFVAGSNNTKLELTFTGNPLPAANVSVNIKKDTIKDLFGNKSAALSINVPVTTDNVKPTITGINVKADNKIELNFSEAVVGSTVASNYVLKDSTGTIVKNKSYANSTGNPIGTFAYSSSDKKVTLTFSGSLAAGSYSLTATGVKDTALVANIMDSEVLNFTVVDTTAPTVTVTGALIAAVSPAGQKLVIMFSESMKVEGVGSILNPSNYYVSGAVLDTDSKLEAGNDNMSVIITLPTATSISSGATVNVGRVADAAGNLTDALSTPVVVSTSANVAIVGKAATTSTTTVEMEVAYPLASIDATKFTVGGNQAVAASFENKVLSDKVTSGSVITLTVASANHWATNATPSVIVTAAGAAKDSMGRDLAVATTLTDDATAPAYAVVGADDDNKIEAKDSNKNGKIDQIVITYTENLKSSTIGVSTYEIAGYTVDDAQLVGNVVTLTLVEKSTPNTAAVPTVKQVLAIQDTLGNAKDVEETANDSLDKTLAYVQSTSIDAASKTLTVVFSEQMDKTTLVDASDITVGTKLIGTGATFTWSEDGKTLTIVGGAGFDIIATDTITATTATDANANAVDLTATTVQDITF